MVSSVGLTCRLFISFCKKARSSPINSGWMLHPLHRTQCYGMTGEKVRAETSPHTTVFRDIQSCTLLCEVAVSFPLPGGLILCRSQ